MQQAHTELPLPPMVWPAAAARGWADAAPHLHSKMTTSIFFSATDPEEEKKARRPKDLVHGQRRLLLLYLSNEIGILLSVRSTTRTPTTHPYQCGRSSFARCCGARRPPLPRDPTRGARSWGTTPPRIWTFQSTRTSMAPSTSRPGGLSTPSVRVRPGKPMRWTTMGRSHFQALTTRATACTTQKMGVAQCARRAVASALPSVAVYCTGTSSVYPSHNSGRAGAQTGRRTDALRTGGRADALR